MTALSTDEPDTPEPAGGALRVRLDAPLALESGAMLPGIEIAYRTWGRLNAAADNAVLVCHSLTGSADVAAWWPVLLGRGHALDPTRDFIVCSNVLGGCHGTTGPASVIPGSSRVYGPEFPHVTVRDIVHAQARLLDVLGVQRLRLVVGASFGGMQALEWAALYPARVDALALIATSARQSAWAIGLSEAQRQAIRADANWMQGYYGATPPRFGLAAARTIAMLSYRSWHGLETRFGRAQRASGRFEVESYLNYHGGKFAQQFDANSYITLTHAIDSHDIGRGRGGADAALAAITQPALVIGIDSDALYLPHEQQEIARRLPRATLAWLNSPHGHDAFLIESKEINALVAGFRRRLVRQRRAPRRLIGAPLRAITAEAGA